MTRKVYNVSKRMNKFFKINYIYFSVVFLCLLGVHGYSLLLLKDVFLLPLFVTVILQCFLETVLLLSLSVLIEKYFHRSAFYLFISLTCVLLLAHEADFIMTRLMGVSIWFLLHLISYEIGDNFIEMIKSTNISVLIWILGVVCVATIFAIGMLFFHITDKFVEKRKIHLSHKSIGLLLAIPLILILVWDRAVITKLSYGCYEQFRETLPFKKTFFSPTHLMLPKASALKELKNESAETPVIATEKKPPLFVFVIESLREDFITQEIAPHLFQFKQDNISFYLASSGGNASHYSWFTIFHSQFPLRFSKKHIEKTSEKGSQALIALRELGYKIHLYSSAELAFYHMGESIFGKEHILADTFYEFPHGKNLTAAESDKKVMDQLREDEALLSGDGNLFIVFLDATHFGYSWPREEGDRFEPVEDPIDYIKAAFNKGSIEGIKNRYRNAIYYVDSLLGKFLERHQDDDAVILITGDHGEAFYESGKLFHASTLGSEQIHVPLYYKFGKESQFLKSKASKISSHIDIFPTFLDYINGSDAALLGLEGESIFKVERWPYTLTARYNGGREPFEFCLQNLSGKIILQNLTPSQLKVVGVSSPQNPLFLDETKAAFTHIFASE